jgi:Phytanoyl-CoA dioxygenase (PhyH)
VLSVEDISGLKTSLDTEGFAVIPDVVSADRVEQFADEILATYSRAEKFKGGGSFSGHLNCFPGASSSFFYDEIERAGIVAAVHEMRPGVHNRIRATLNFNLPGSVAQHYHMDGLYVEDFIICNIGVVHTDLMNGAIDLLPGTQREFMKFWQYALRREYQRSTRVPMEPGDVLLRRSTLWHRGMPNKSATPRPMMSITFGEASAPEQDPFGVHEGKMYFYPNWFNTSRLGQLRERTFVAAPVTYSAYRFAKSLHGNRGYDHY